MTTFFVQLNGLELKGGLLLFFSGIFYYFFVIVFLGTWELNSYIRQSNKTKLSFIKRFSLVVTFAIVSFFVYFTLDNLYFLIDDSLSVEFVNYVKKEYSIDFEDAAEHPFSYIAISTPLGFLGVFVAMLLVKKDGQLLKNKEKEY